MANFVLFSIAHEAVRPLPHQYFENEWFLGLGSAWTNCLQSSWLPLGPSCFNHDAVALFPREQRRSLRGDVKVLQTHWSSVIHCHLPEITGMLYLFYICCWSGYSRLRLRQSLISCLIAWVLLLSKYIIFANFPWVLFIRSVVCSLFS